MSEVGWFAHRVAFSRWVRDTTPELACESAWWWWAGAINQWPWALEPVRVVGWYLKWLRTGARIGALHA